MADYSTITLKAETKARLALLKGSKSWDEFLEELADHYPTETVIAEMERRLAQLKDRTTKGVPWRETDTRRARER